MGKAGRPKKVLEETLIKDDKVFPEPEVKMPEIVKETVVKPKPQRVFTEGGFEEIEEPKTYERMPIVAMLKKKAADDALVEVYWEDQDKVKELLSRGYDIIESRRTGLAYGKHKLLIFRRSV